MKTISIMGIMAMTCALNGCQLLFPSSPKPQQTLQVSNQAYTVDKLFTDPNGVSVYRFSDQGDYRYYVVGPDGAHMMPTTHTVVEEDVETDVVTVDSGGGGHGGGGHHH